MNCRFEAEPTIHISLTNSCAVGIQTSGRKADHNIGTQTKRARSVHTSSKDTNFYSQLSEISSTLQSSSVTLVKLQDETKMLNE